MKIPKSHKNMQSIQLYSPVVHDRRADASMSVHNLASRWRSGVTVPRRDAPLRNAPPPPPSEPSGTPSAIIGFGRSFPGLFGHVRIDSELSWSLRTCSAGVWNEAWWEDVVGELGEGKRREVLKLFVYFWFLFGFVVFGLFCLWVYVILLRLWLLC